MTPRKLARELRDYPATSFICLIWIAIFAAMTYCELADRSRFLTPARWLLLGFPGGDRFGDLTLGGLGQGQIWRLITCNFIHFSLIHLGLNLLAMYQLGSMVEEWYGSYQFLLIYAVLGGGGNLVSALIRYGMGSSANVHSGGGSVIIMGLVGMCAVVGWRARDRWGKTLSRLMMMFLLLTAIMGILLPGYIDNWGHAGGAMVGAPVGLADRRLLANRSKPSAWGMGMVAGLIMASCGAAQYIDDLRADPVRRQRDAIARSERLVKAAHDLTFMSRLLERGGGLDGVHEDLRILEQILDGPARAEISGLRTLVEGARNRPLSGEEKQQLEGRLERAIREVRQDYLLQQRRLRELPRTGRARR
jgi:membrane associated rhomboid family serine protease